jgi:6-phosphogluconolactonase (cycloisomerase 2 family)
VAVFPITPSSTTPPSDVLGSPIANGGLNYWPLVLPGKPNDIIVPTAVTVLKSGAYIYVSAYDSSVSPNAGYVFGFSAGSGGALTSLNGGVPFMAGTHPSAIVGDPSSSYVYVTDIANGNVLGYSVQSGTLAALASSPFPAGDQPSAIVIDPTYPFAYVTNSADSSITSYSTSNGALTRLGTSATGLQPVAIGIDPSTNHFLYTANYLGSGINGSITGFELNPTTGSLLVSQNSPYQADALPTAVAAIPHGSSGSSSKSTAP